MSVHVASVAADSNSSPIVAVAAVDSAAVMFLGVAVLNDVEYNAASTDPHSNPPLVIRSNSKKVNWTSPRRRRPNKCVAVPRIPRLASY